MGKVLGKGLEAIIKTNNTEEDGRYLQGQIDINKIIPNKNQPRQLFDDDKRDNYDNNINNLLEQNNIDMDTENLICRLSNSWTQHTGLGDGCSDNRSARDRINAIIEQNRQMKTTTELNRDLPAGWTALPSPSGIYYHNPNATPSNQPNRPVG